MLCSRRAGRGTAEWGRERSICTHYAGDSTPGAPPARPLPSPTTISTFLVKTRLQDVAQCPHRPAGLSTVSLHGSVCADSGCHRAAATRPGRDRAVPGSPTLTGWGGRPHSGSGCGDAAKLRKLEAWLPWQRVTRVSGGAEAAAGLMAENRPCCQARVLGTESSRRRHRPTPGLPGPGVPALAGWQGRGR